MARVPVGIHRATLHQAKETESTSTLIFQNRAPEGFSPGRQYAAEHLDGAALTGRFRQLRGKTSQAKLSRQTKIAVTSISNAERYPTETPFCALSDLYTGLGGGALFLSFFSSADAEQTTLPLSVVQAKDYFQIPQWFTEMYKGLSLTKAEVAERVGVARSSVSDFEEASQPLPTTVARYFRAACQLEVAFCGVVDPAVSHQ